MTAEPGPDDGWARPPARRGLHAGDLVLIQRAAPVAQRVVRGRLRAWLDAAGWEPDASEDILLAVSEAVTNVIDHAYPPAQPGPVHVHAWISPDPVLSRRRSGGPEGGVGSRQVTVTVVDRGRWRVPDRGRDTAGHRGRGLEMMRALTAALHLQPSDAGTTVVLISPAAPAVRLHPLDNGAALRDPV